MTQGSTTTGELVARIRAYAEDDHERLCQGREYSCSCGYDERRDPLLSEAAEALTTLERELEEARASNEQWQEIANENGIVADTAKAERDEALRHVELLQNKINGPKECACAYDGPDDICMHHSPQLAASQAEVERLKEALGHHERLLLIATVRKSAEEAAPLWLEAADNSSEAVRAQVKP